MFREGPGRNISVVSPWKRLTGRQWAFDVAIALAMLALGLIGSMQIGEHADSAFTRDIDVFHYVLIALLTLPLALRRVYTVPVFIVVLLTWIVDRGLDYPDTPASAAVAIVFFTVGAELDRRGSLLVGGISAAVITGWTALGIVVLESVTASDLFTTLIATLTPLLLGREMHERRRRVEELRERAERAEREREERAKQAVLEERSRIARELHDVVAHQMTVVTLQAEGAKRVAAGSDPRVIEALETIRTAGHSALTEMRRTLGLLRRTDDTAQTVPLPRLSDIDDLISQMRAAGVEVDFEVTGERRPLSDGAELSAYRIVQESLTNAVRHGGPGVAASVAITFEPDHLEVSVSDDGRGSASGTDNGGHGIIGMQERIAVLGGEFQAGPKAGGGFLVHATIPIE